MNGNSQMDVGGPAYGSPIGPYTVRQVHNDIGVPKSMVVRSDEGHIKNGSGVWNVVLIDGDTHKQATYGSITAEVEIGHAMMTVRANMAGILGRYFDPNDYLRKEGTFNDRHAFVSVQPMSSSKNNRVAVTARVEYDPDIEDISSIQPEVKDGIEQLVNEMTR